MAETRESLERRLDEERKSLHLIEEKIAQYTELEAPIHLLKQRDDAKARIAQIKEQLRYTPPEPPPPVPPLPIAGCVAVIVLIVAALIIGVVIAVVIIRSRPDLLAPTTEFGIAIAEFGQGPKFKSSDTGQEICEVLHHELERRLKAANAAEGITLQRAGIVRSSNQAERFGQKGYKIVVWGWWLSEPSGRAVIPTFTVSHLREAASFTIYGVLDAPFAALETVELGQHLGARAEFLMTFLLGLTHLDQGDYGKAIDGLSIAISDAEEIALELEPESREATTLQKSQAFLYYYRGRAHFALGELELAQKNFQRALALNPNLVSPYIGLGNIFFRRGDMTSAAKKYEKAAELDPQSIGAQHGIGNVHFVKGDFFQSIQSYKKAIEYGEKTKQSAAPTHYTLGLIYEELGAPDKAVDELAQAARSSESEELKQSAEEYIARIQTPVPGTVVARITPSHTLVIKTPSTPTQVSTATSTSTPDLTSTPPLVPTPTNMPTPTATQSPTPTSTPTYTPTPTETATPTSTPTTTPTDTPTSTPTPTLPPAAHPGTLYVNGASGSDTTDCTNSVSPCATISYALDQAEDFDTILVAEGTYTENLVITKTITLKGGYEPGSWSRSLDRYTAIDGNKSGRVINVESTLSETTVIDGFTITNGNGGIRVLLSSVAIENSKIVHNHTSGSHSGGGMLIDHSSVYITNTLIADNAANNHDGAMRIISTIAIPGPNSYVSINSSTIANNKANNGRNGIFCSLSWCTAVNSIVWDHEGEDFSGHGYGATYSDIEMGLSGEGNISVDPLFVDPANGDYHLRSDSPGIDAGTNESAPETDFEGDPRPLDGDQDDTAITDMGADETQ